MPTAEDRFIGRSAELAELESAFQRAAAGRPGAVLVGGEAGIGKTRLVCEFVARAGGAGRPPVIGHCVQCSEGGLPYGPWIDIARQLVRGLGPGSVVELLGDSAAELDRLVPGVLGASPRDLGAHGSGGGSRAGLFEVLRALVGHAASQAPLLIVIEDVHWADESTRDVIAFLLANLVADPVLLVLTYRTDDLPRGHPLRTYLAELARRSGAARFELDRFTRQEVSTQVADHLGTTPPPALVQSIWQRSEGNPFFAEELLATPANAGDALPATLRDILAGRLRVVSPGTQRVLRAAAAGGKRVGHRLLAAAVDLDADQLDDALREARDHQLLVLDPADECWSLRHALLREVAYSELLPGERSRIHAAYARALDDRADLAVGPDRLASELAHHWIAAGEPAPALVASVAAARAAEQVFGFAEAEDHYLTALRLWDQVAGASGSLRMSHSELSERTAAAAHLAGDHRRAAALIADAIEEVQRSHPVRAGVLSSAAGRYLSAAGEAEQAGAAHERALLLVPASPPSAERATVLAAYADALTQASRYRESLAVAGEAVAIAQAVGARPQEGQALATMGVDLAQLDDDAAGVRHLRHALAIAAEAGRADDVGRAYLSLSELLAGPLNRVDEAVAVADEGAAHASAAGLDRTYGVSLQAAAANGLFRLGRWDEADALVARILERRPSGAVAIELYLARGRLAVGRGRFPEAHAALETAAELCRRAVEPRHTAPLHTLVAGLALWEGRLDDAGRAVEDGLAGLGDTEEVWFVAPLVWHGLRVEAERADGARARRAAAELDGARRGGAVLLARMRRLAAASARAPRASRQIVEAYERLCEGELSRVMGASAAGPWLAAVDAWDGVGQRYPAAYARFRAAEAMLSTRQARVEPAALLAAAHAVARDLGAAPFLAEIQRLAMRARIDLDVTDGAPAGAAGAHPPGPAPADVLGLTPREVEVLALVAAGRTNPQIAAALFISPKTASVHVSNILAKLGVTTRVEAATVAYRMGLDHPA
ncbi:MAG TPA: AAA family ATPase [Acidimicrobiales bacterium]|nr:AAA family ATPase [Acidimicrobiales bacterium]